MITEDYVSFETAKLLKEKGFEGECVSYYSEFVDNNTTLCRWRKTHSYVNVKNDAYTLVPTLQMALKWLREVHNIHIEFTWYSSYRGNNLFSYHIDKMNVVAYDGYDSDEEYIYEEAAEAAIKYCLENLI